VIIDVHAHLTPPALSEAIAASGRPARRRLTRFATPSPTLAERLAMMDEAGVERQILSVASGFQSADRAAAVACASAVNDQFSALCRDHPDRFSFWATLPLPHVAEAVAELDRALALPGCVGVSITCSVMGRSVADPEFEPLYARLQDHAGVVFLHPSQNALGSALIADFDLTVCAGASMEDTVAALHLIARRVPERYPAVRFIVPHFGGLLPMLLERLDGQMIQDDFAEPPSATARRFFYDTVGWGSAPALIAAVRAFGASQLVPGSDYPILLPWEGYARTFQHICEAGLPDHECDQILHHNARGLLGL
jgi:aminocarboxymuconate-semialdehyde decarboxylase